MTVKFTNNASSTVATGINTSATSLTVADASTFPSLSGADDYCYLTIQGATSTTREVVKATALSSNTFTIVRAQDNTTAGTWSNGDIVELRLTAALLQDVIDQATVEGIKTNFQYIPTANQTQFSGADNSGDTMIINDAELINVYMNGVRLVQGSDYTVSSANNRVTLATGATTADVIDIEVFGNFTGQSGAAVAITGGAIAGTAITTGSINNTPVGATQANTVAATTLTANSVAVDNITVDGNEIDVSSGDLTLDVAGNIILDADGAIIKFQDGGTDIGSFQSGSQNLIIRTAIADKDIKLQGYDGDLSTLVTGLTIDFSEGGKATFANDIAVVDDRGLRLGSDNDSVIYNDGSNLYIKNNTTNQAIIFQGNDDGSTGTTVLTLDMSSSGIATFNSGINIGNRGSASDPTLQSAIDPNTGVYWGGGDILGLSSGGVERFRVSGDGASAKASHTATDVTSANSNMTLSLANPGVGDGVFNALAFNGNQQDMYIMSFNDSTQADRRIGFFVGSAAGDATTDERLSIRGNGNIGLGTNSPSARATIKTASNEEDAILIEQSDGTDVGSIRINNGSFLIKGKSSSAPVQLQTHDGNEDIEVDPDGFIKMETAGVERIRIDQHGTLAVGTTDTHQWSVFDGRIRLGAIGSFATTSTSTQVISNAYYNGAYRYIAAQGASRYYQTGGAHYWEVASSGSADAAISFSEAMRLTASAELGLGLSNPQNYYSTDLVVGAADQGGITIAASGTTNTNYLLFADGTSGDAQYRGQIAYQHDGDKLNVVSTGIVQFMSGSGRGLKATLSAAGNLNIGMPAGYNAEGKLHVYNGASGKSYAADSADQLILENSSSVCLDIRTPNANNGVILFSDQDARGSGQINYSHNGDDMYIMTGGTTSLHLPNNKYLVAQGASQVRLVLGSQGNANNNTSNWIRGNGTEVDINTAGGDFNLEIGGSKKLTVSGNNLNLVGGGYVGASGGFWFYNDSDTGMYRSDTNEISFRVGGNDYFTIDGDSTGYTHKFNNGSYSWYVGTSGNVFNFYTGEGTQRGYVNTSGFQNGSDVSYKENIVDINRGLAEVLQLRPRKFDIKDTIDMEDSDKVLVGDKDALGFIAQEMETAIPELVNGEDGSKTIGYAQLTAVLTKAIQEQQTLIETLTARVTELENN